MQFVNSLLLGVALVKVIKSRKGKSNLPSFSNVLEVKHQMPGRIRFKCPKLIDNIHEATELKRQLIKVQGIHDVSTNDVTGSILIEYDHETIDPSLLIAALVKLLHLEDGIDRNQMAKLRREVVSVGNAVNHGLMSMTAGWVDTKTVLPVAFVSMAAYQLVSGTSRLLPSPLTLLFWAYNVIGLGGDS